MEPAVADEVTSDCISTEETTTSSETTPAQSITGERIQTITSSPRLEETERELTNSLERTSTPTTPTTPNNSPMKHLSQRDSSWLEIDVCREFLRGECTRSAEECRFAHPTGSVVIKEGNKVTCCFDFLKDRCTRETCKYLHPSNLVKDRLVMAGKQYGQVMALSSTKPLIASPLSPAMQPLPVGGAFPIPYSYIGQPLASTSLSNTSTSYSLPYYSTRMEVCDTYEQGYSCANGDNCLFAHPESHVRINSDNTVSVCWNFLNGYCRHQNCWFYHPTQIQLMTFQPNRVIPQPLPPLDSVFMTPYSTDSKVTQQLHQPQLSPSMISPYSFVLPPQVVPMSSIPPSPTTQFSTTFPQQTIVS